MKKVFLIFALALSLFAISNSDAADKKADAAEPRYEITVTQSGKEMGKIV